MSDVNWAWEELPPTVQSTLVDWAGAEWGPKAAHSDILDALVEDVRNSRVAWATLEEEWAFEWKQNASAALTDYLACWRR